MPGTEPRYRCPGTGCTGLVADVYELCSDCWAFRTVLLGRIRSAWHAAHGYLVPRTRHGERVTGGAGPSSISPLNEHAFAAIETALAVVVGWASRIRERQGKAPLPHMSIARPGFLFEYAMPILGQFDDMLTGIEKIDYYGDLFHVSRGLLAITHEAARESEHLMIACPECGRMTIIVRDYGDRVVCLTCTSDWGQAAFHARLTSRHVVV